MPIILVRVSMIVFFVQLLNFYLKTLAKAKEKEKGNLDQKENYSYGFEKMILWNNKTELNVTYVLS